MENGTLTRTQEKQLAFLESLEHKNGLYEWQHGGRTRLTILDCHDYTTGESKQMHCPDGARAFVLNRAGHKTWITFIGYQN